MPRDVYIHKRKPFTKPHKAPSYPIVPRKGKLSALLYAMKAMREIRKVKTQMNAEHKYLDYNISALNVDYNGHQYNLNVMAQGDTDTTRDGDSIKVLNDSINLVVTRNGADALVRVIVFWDQMAKYSAVGNFLATTGSILAPLSPRNHDSRFWFKTLYDQVYSVTADQPQQMDKIRIKINRHTQFDAGTTTVDSGVLRILLISDQVTSNLPVVDFTSRCFFTDN